MSIDDYYTEIDKEMFYKEKIKRLMTVYHHYKNTGKSEGEARALAEMEIFKPKKLENINLDSDGRVGMRPHLQFYFNSDEEIEIIKKYFKVSAYDAVSDASLLMDLLDGMENG